MDNDSVILLAISIITVMFVIFIGAMAYRDGKVDAEDMYKQRFTEAKEICVEVTKAGHEFSKCYDVVERK